jgi:lipopolysaccharide biosynthesis regulator YciM
MGEAGRQVALSEYTIAGYVDRIEAIYRRLADAHRQHRDVELA